MFLRANDGSNVRVKGKNGVTIVSVFWSKHLNENIFQSIKNFFPLTSPKDNLCMWGGDYL